MTRFRGIFTIIMASAFLLGCSDFAPPVADTIVPPNLANPKTHSRSGLTFSYPRNWSVTDDKFDDSDRSIDLYDDSVDGAHVSITITDTSGNEDNWLKNYLNKNNRKIAEQEAITEKDLFSYIYSTKRAIGEPETWDQYTSITETQDIWWFLVSRTRLQVVHRHRTIGGKQVYAFAIFNASTRKTHLPAFDLILSTLRLNDATEQAQ